MFLRPHHLQTGQRYLETITRTALDGTRAFAWGFLGFRIAEEPLENFTLRLDGCTARFKDGTWAQVPDNTKVGPLNFQDALEANGGQVDLYFGIPSMQEVRANAVSLQEPDRDQGTPRYEPYTVIRRDENTGQNPQSVYVRHMRGRLFTADEDMTGYEVLPLGRIRRSDRPGAIPEMDLLGAGPLLTAQADAGLSGLINSLTDQVEAKNEVLAREAREHRMMFTDGVASNLEHLLKLHTLNESRAHLRALQQCPVLHPYDLFVVFCRLIGHLSVFHDDLVPGALPAYIHDRPGETFDQVRRRLEVLLEAMRPGAYAERRFERRKDAQGREGLSVELDRGWIDENLEMYVGLRTEDMDIHELQRFIQSRLNFKLASPSRAPKITNIAVSGLKFDVRSVPAGTLPRRPGLHYFKIDKTIGSDRTDYWKECEQERGIRISIQEGQLNALEEFAPTLYIIMKGRA